MGSKHEGWYLREASAPLKEDQHMLLTSSRLSDNKDRGILHSFFSVV